MVLKNRLRPLPSTSFSNPKAFYYTSFQATYAHLLEQRHKVTGTNQYSPIRNSVASEYLWLALRILEVSGSILGLAVSLSGCHF
jgi:hypothetical protein